MKIFALLGLVSAWPLVSRQTNSSIPATMVTSSNSTTNGTMSSNSTMTNSTIDMSSSAMQLLYCNATNQRYVPAMYHVSKKNTNSRYVCFPTALCKVGLMACGVACYDPRMYGCLNGALFQVGMLPVDVGNPNVAVVAAPSTSTSSGNTTMTVMASNGTMSGNSTM